MRKISFIQWFIRLVKRDMKEFEREKERGKGKKIRKTKKEINRKGEKS